MGITPERLSLCIALGIVDSAYLRAVEILKLSRSLLEEGAKQLLAKETLQEQGLKELFSRIKEAGDKPGNAAATSACSGTHRLPAPDHNQD